MQYPPPSWRLRGNGLLRLQPLPLDQVRHAVPPDLAIVSVAPGRTLGGMFVAHYGAGSTREYHELIVFPALVRRGSRVGAWISHIYVDDLQSLAAGREVWGLPKVFAKFRWQQSSEATEVLVSDEQGTLCSLAATPARARLRLPLYAPVLAQLNGWLISYAGKGRAKIGTGHCDLYIPANRPFSSFGFTEGRHMQLDRFNLTLPEPGRIAQM